MTAPAGIRLRVGHVGLQVPDLDRSVAFAEQVIGLREVERDGGTSYLTCNERHHELVLVEDRRPRATTSRSRRSTPPTSRVGVPGDDERRRVGP